MCVSYYTDPKNRVGRDIKHFILSEYFVAPKLKTVIFFPLHVNFLYEHTLKITHMHPVRRQ